jgi:hypothetical protein
VIEADGTVSPVQHGFDRAYTLGNLLEAPLPVLASRWRAEGGPARLRTRCEAALANVLAQQDDLPIFNWHDVLTAA